MRYSQFALACLLGMAFNAHAGVTITNHTAVNITATSAQLRADATESGGSTYSAYFEYGESTAYGTLSPTQSGVVAPNLTSRVLSNPISGLTCGTTYHFRMVVPTGANGVDSTFNTSSCQAGPPGSPVNPVATAGNASATVAFTAPTSNGGAAITGYTVTSNPAGGVDQNAGSTSLTHTITGLTNGTSYSFTVTATNSAGTSAASAASTPVTPSSGGGSGTIPLLNVAVSGIKSMPQPLNMTLGQGPTFINAIMTSLATTLKNDHLIHEIQNEIGVVKVVGHGANAAETLVFSVVDYQTGDTRPNGLYPTGNGSYKVVHNGASVTLIPAVMSLLQLTALYPNVNATITASGAIVAPIGPVTYVVKPAISVKQHFPTTATPSLLPGVDDIPTFTDKDNQSQQLHPAFAEPETLRNALKNIDPNATMDVQVDGTVAARVNGNNYTLVPDQTLGSVPTAQSGRLWWQDGPARYHLLNLTNSGTSQGLTVK